MSAAANLSGLSAALDLDATYTWDTERHHPERHLASVRHLRAGKRNDQPHLLRLQ
jgi:hypothetical protein